MYKNVLSKTFVFLEQPTNKKTAKKQKTTEKCSSQKKEERLDF